MACNYNTLGLLITGVSTGCAWFVICSPSIHVSSLFAYIAGVCERAKRHLKQQLQRTWKKIWAFLKNFVPPTMNIIKTIISQSARTFLSLIVTNRGTYMYIRSSYDRVCGLQDRPACFPDGSSDMCCLTEPREWVFILCWCCFSITP